MTEASLVHYENPEICSLLSYIEYGALSPRYSTISKLVLILKDRLFSPPNQFKLFHTSLDCESFYARCDGDSPASSQRRDLGFFGFAVTLSRQER